MKTMRIGDSVHGRTVGVRGACARAQPVRRVTVDAGREGASSSARSPGASRGRSASPGARGGPRGGRGRSSGRGGGGRGRGRDAPSDSPRRRRRGDADSDPATSAAYAELGFLDPLEAKRIQLELRRQAQQQPSGEAAAAEAGDAAAAAAASGIGDDPPDPPPPQSAAAAAAAAGPPRSTRRLFADALLDADTPPPPAPAPRGARGSRDAAGAASTVRPRAPGGERPAPRAHQRAPLAAAAAAPAPPPAAAYPGGPAWSGGTPPPPPPIPIVRPDDSDKGTFFSGDSWAGLGCDAPTVEALRGLGFRRPSHVQAEALRLVQRTPPHIAVADQAGSGKTLAYLLPLLLQLKQREAALGRPATEPGRVGVIVLAPTNELAQQVYRVAKALSGAGVRFRSALVTGSDDADEARRNRAWRTQAETLKGGLDLVVSTPGRLLSHLSRGSFTLAATRAVVLDEVDVLAGEEGGYEETVTPLQAAAGPEGLQFWLVSATLPVHVFAQLQSLFPGLAAAFGPGLHKTAAGLVEELVDCSGGEEVSLESGQARKLGALDERLRAVGATRALVFCNKIETCRLVENHLKRQVERQEGSARRYEVHAFHEAVRADLRTAALGAFLAPASPASTPQVLVCTDRTSRGIDAMFCEHVVLFDFPRDPSEYVRRVGRTARGAGGRGVVSVLVLGKQVALARDIIERNQKGAPVHRIPEVSGW